MNRETVQDPVCGMIFEPDQAAAVLEWEGRLFHFCCESCLRAFEADPGVAPTAPSEFVSSAGAALDEALGPAAG